MTDTEKKTNTLKNQHVRLLDHSGVSAKKMYVCIKNPNHKRSRRIRKRVLYTCKRAQHIRNGTQISAKVPKISAKEPCLSTTKPCMSAEEPCVYAKDPDESIRKPCVSTKKSCTSANKSDMSSKEP